jgi:hypothetical protein
MKLTAILILTGLLPAMLSAQKRMCSYPFEFEKSFLQRSDYDAYFLDNQKQESFALILKDNKKADYVLLNKQFKVVAKVASDIKSTVFDEDDYTYAGGTSTGNEYHFVYSGKDGFQMETVNFDTKAVGHKKIFALTKQEKALTSFTSENRFFALTTNDKSNELTLYTVNERGELATKVLPFTIPAEVEKSRNKLSTYLSRLRVMKSEEEPDFSNAVVDAKLFNYPDHFDFVINDKDNPTHVVSVQLPGLQVQEKFIPYEGIVPANEKGNVYVSSFEKNGKIFSLLLNKKNIRLAVHDLSSGSLLNKYEINEDKGAELFVQAPVTERRYGKREDAKDVDDVKKLIKMLTRGTEGVMVTENKTGQLVVTIGTYDLIPISTGGGGGGWVGGWQNTMATSANGSVRPVQTWNPNMYYRPGTPTYTTTSARYYTTTYFKLMLDPTTLKTTRGRLPRPVAEQVKDYLESVDKKAKATNQFCIGKDQFYGYYDSDAKAYVIDQIKIFQ